MTLGIYVRISDDPTDTRAGVERQLKDCHDIARVRWPDEPTVVYDDNDRSAYNGSKRPAFLRMLDDLKLGVVTGVIAWSHERLIRQPLELERFIELCEARKYTRVITAFGDLDLTTAEGRLVARLLGAVARNESDLKARRVKRAAQDRASKGMWGQGKAPYGYVLDPMTKLPVVDPIAAEHVRQAAEDVARGVPISHVVRRGNGPRTITGWQATLASPAIAGMTSMHVVAQWPAIVPLAIWNQIAQDRESHLPRTKNRGGDHWVSVLLRCSRCGATMTATSYTGSSRSMSYACRLGGHVSINRRHAEEFVEDALFEIAKGQRRSTDEKALRTHGRNAKSEQDHRLAILISNYLDGALSEAEWSAAREKVIHAGIPRTPTIIPIDLEARWPAMSSEERSIVARRGIRRVTVAPAVRGASGAPAARARMANGIQWADEFAAEGESTPSMVVG